MTGSPTGFLSLVAGAMLVPDVLLLLGFAGFSLLNLGGLIGESLSRWRRRAQWKTLLSGSDACMAADAWREDILAELRRRPTAAPQILDHAQLAVERRLDRLLLGVRLGPILGLAGTLIPLGPTLLALTQWDLAALSSQLVVAFNATIVGLFIGGACYTTHLIRRGWYRADLTELEHEAARLATRLVTRDGAAACAVSV